METTGVGKVRAVLLSQTLIRDGTPQAVSVRDGTRATLGCLRPPSRRRRSVRARSASMRSSA